jgi:hypothetical protein
MRPLPLRNLGSWKLKPEEARNFSESPLTPRSGWLGLSGFSAKATVLPPPKVEKISETLLPRKGHGKRGW